MWIKKRGFHSASIKSDPCNNLSNLFPSTSDSWEENLKKSNHYNVGFKWKSLSMNHQQHCSHFDSNVNGSVCCYLIFLFRSSDVNILELFRWSAKISQDDFLKELKRSKQKNKRNKKFNFLLIKEQVYLLQRFKNVDNKILNCYALDYLIVVVVIQFLLCLD